MLKIFLSRKNKALVILFLFVGSFCSSSKANVSSRGAVYLAKGLGALYTGIGFCSLAAAIPLYFASESSKITQLKVLLLSIGGVSVLSLGGGVLWLGSKIS